MASKVKSSTLNLTVKEDITLNNVRYSYESKQSIPDVNMVSQRIIRVPHDSTEFVLKFGTAISAGTYVAGDIKYIRITNLDDTNYVTLGLLDTATYDRAYFKLEKGETMVFHNTKLEAHAENSTFTAFVDIDTINAKADTAAVDIEIFVASSQS